VRRNFHLGRVFDGRHSSLASRRAAHAIVLALAFGSALAGLSCTGASPTVGYELEGRVTDDFTGSGLSGADVTFTSDTGFSAATRADSGGRYRMAVESDVPFGQVRAEHDGYTAAEATVFFDTEARVIDLTLRPL